MPHQSNINTGDTLSTSSPNETPITTTDMGLLEPIAVVGFSLKFPQDAVSADGFWKMMEEKRCAMTGWPKDRLNIDAFHHPDKNKSNTVSKY